MKRFLVVVAALAACSSKSQDKPAPAPAPPAIDAAAPKPPPPPPPPKQVTGEDRAKRYDDCWSYFNAGKYDEFKGCFTADGINNSPGVDDQGSKPDAIISNLKELRASFPDVKGTPQLVMVSGSTVIGFALLTGTQTGPMQGPGGVMPATNNKIGLYMGAVIDTDETGRSKRESDYFDVATMMAQLAPDKAHPTRVAPDKPAMTETVAIAKGDDKEKANLATYQALVDAFGKHDLKKFGELIADDVVWSEQAEPMDQTKKDVLAGMPQAWKSMSDLKLVSKQAWAGRRLRRGGRELRGHQRRPDPRHEDREGHEQEGRGPDAVDLSIRRRQGEARVDLLPVTRDDDAARRHAIEVTVASS